ncbi:unnamed protein product [Ilex paraguariensis]|uniref:Zinc-finger domain-containing protein n=1 Tax=Ilex paraguariensis TaxID=185542 RepID=A0ABC8THE6_9AQUA
MVIERKRVRTLETPANPVHKELKHDNGEAIETANTTCGYEQAREERIKENLERMQKLGILDLSLKLKSVKPTHKNNLFNRKTPQRPSPLPRSGPARRSSRLQSLTPVSYSEVQLSNKDASLGDKYDLLREEGSKPEVYSEEHEKLLGNTEMSWTLFVDGYGKDGRRIYDPIKGKTCHQCRQKTLGHRTHCSQCNLVQGQFCGDCLYMRYGEHVLEANQNPNWICPACRGICNCSLCRQAKGWAPTGALYRKISSLGFKSVAHYLIQTRRSDTDPEKNPGSKVPLSAKRSIPFSDMEANAEETVSPDSKNDLQRLVNPVSEENRTDNDFEGEKDEKINFSDSSTNGHIDVAQERNTKLMQKSALSTESSDDHLGLSKPEIEDNKIDDEANKIDDDLKDKKEEKLQFVDNKLSGVILAPENSPKSKEKPARTTEPDSIGRRLKQRRTTEANVNSPSSKPSPGVYVFGFGPNPDFVI